MRNQFKLTRDKASYGVGFQRFCSVLPSKNSLSIRSRSSGLYLIYFPGFFPFSIFGLINKGKMRKRKQKFRGTALENIYSIDFHVHVSTICNYSLQPRC